MASTALVAGLSIADGTFNSAAFADTTWTGGTSADWTDGDNWSGAVEPIASENVTIAGAVSFQPILATSSNALTSTVISAGTLTVTSAGTLNSTNVTVSGGTLDNAGTVAGNISVTSGTLTNSGTLTGGVSVTGTGTLTATANTTLGATTLGAGSTFSAANGVTLLQNGTFSMIQVGAVNIGSATETGTVEFRANGGAFSTGASFYVQGGTFAPVSANASSVLADIAGTTLASGATLDIGGVDTTVKNLSGAGTVTNSAASDRALTLTGTSTVTGGIQDGSTNAINLVRSGAGTTALNGDLTYTGTTSVAGGTLSLGGTGNTIGEISIADGAALTLTETGAEGSGSGDITTTGATGTVGFGDGVSNAKNIVASTNTDLTLNVATGEATQAGSVNAGATGNVSITGAGTLNLGDLTANTLTSGGNLALSGATLTSVAANGGNVTLSGANTIGTATVNNGTLTLGGTITGLTNVTVGDGTIGPGTDRLVLNTVLSGATTIETQGSVISYGADSGALINLNSNNTQLEVTGAGSFTQSGVISETAGPRPIEKIGTGTLILSAANTYTGVTSVTAGTLTLTGSLDSSGVNINGGTFVNNSGTTGLLGSASITVAGGTLTTNGADTVTNVTQNGASTINGSAILTATGTYLQSAGDMAGTLAAGTQSLTGGTISGTLSNASAATTVNTGTTTLTGSIAATAVTIAGGTLINQTGGASGLDAGASVTVAGGTLTTNGADTVTNVTQNGASTINGSAILTATGTYLQSAGDMAGTLAAGTQSLTGGTISGTLSNASAATTVNTGTTTLTGSIAATAVTIAGGTLDNQSGGLASGASVTVNGGTLTNTAADTVTGVTLTTGTIDGGATLTTDTYSQAGGELAVGATVDASSSQTLTGGTISGSLTGAGAITASGSATLSGTGSISNAASFTKTSGTFTMLSGSSLAAGTITNTAGDFIMTNALVSGAFGNSGTIIATGNNSITGSLGGGTVDLLGTGVGDTLLVTGNITSATAFALSSNLTAGTSDTVTVTGTTGASPLTFNFTNTGTGYLGAPIDVLIGNDAAYTYSFSGLPIGGTVVYSLDQSGNNLAIVSQVSAGVTGIAASTSLVQSLIGNVVNRPTSPFVSGLATEEGCSQGGYARGTIGRANIKGSTSDGITASQQSSVSATFQGMQAGWDVGCNDGRFFDGWDGAAGALLGFNTGRSAQDVIVPDGSGGTIKASTTYTSFDQKYAGVYGAISKDRLTADVQLRFENTKFDVSEVGALDPLTNGGSDGSFGLLTNSFSARSTNLTGRVSYRLDLNDQGLNFVPTAGVSLTRTSGNTLQFAGGETLKMEAFNSTVGFVGGTIAKTKIAPTGDAGTTYFASGNYYHDFAAARKSIFTDAALNSQNLQTKGIGGFGELSLGVNYVKILEAGPAGAKQLNANVRIDTRFGKNVKKSTSLTAQVRLSF